MEEDDDDDVHEEVVEGESKTERREREKKASEVRIDYLCDFNTLLTFIFTSDIYFCTATACKI